MNLTVPFDVAFLLHRGPLLLDWRYCRRHHIVSRRCGRQERRRFLRGGVRNRRSLQLLTQSRCFINSRGKSCLFLLFLLRFLHLKSFSAPAQCTLHPKSWIVTLLGKFQRFLIARLLSLARAFSSSARSSYFPVSFFDSGCADTGGTATHLRARLVHAVDNPACRGHTCQ